MVPSPSSIGNLDISAVYMDRVLLESAERVWVNYGVGGQKPSGYVEAFTLDIIPRQEGVA